MSSSTSSAKMGSEFMVFYLDNGTLGGNKEDIICNIINQEDANLLGSPIGGSQWVDACLNEKIELLCLMGDRLEH